MKFISVTIFSLLVSFCQAQKIEQYYDFDWRILNSADNARYYTLITKDDSLWHRRDYFIIEKHLQMNGWYLDSAATVKQGNFTFFYASGNIESFGKYDSSKKVGLWKYYHDNGSLKDSIVYNNGQKIGASVGFFKNGAVRDSSFFNQNGSGKVIAWNDNGNLFFKGEYGPGIRQQGVWTYYHRNGKISSIESYDTGRLVNKQYFDEDGKSIADTTNTDRHAQFPGGPQKWMRYVQKNSYVPENYGLKRGQKVTVVVAATIDEEGKLTDIRITDPFAREFNQIALNVMRDAPDWIPAISHNRKVKYPIRQPITFVQTN